MSAPLDCGQSTGALRVDLLHRQRERPLCANGCMSAAGVRVAVARVAVLGYPLPGRPERVPGMFCAGCTEQIRAQWQSALDGVRVVDDGRPRCACGCGTVVSVGSSWVRGHQGKDPAVRARGVGSKPAAVAA
jgi:hypothetical protein